MKKAFSFAFVLLFTIIAVGCGEPLQRTPDSEVTSEQEVSVETESSELISSDGQHKAPASVEPNVPVTDPENTSSMPIEKKEASPTPTRSESEQNGSASDSCQMQSLSDQQITKKEAPPAPVRPQEEEYSGMTEDEVDEIINQGIAYAQSKGMTWYDGFSIEASGYFPPAYSMDGAEIFRRDLFYLVDQIYDLSITDSYYEEGNLIYYKIVKGPCKDLGGWFGYVLY